MALSYAMRSEHFRGRHFVPEEDVKFCEKMALKESEVRVLAILGLVILILWSLFGLFWSLLLVFTFLIYAYNFGRHGAGNYTRREPELERDCKHDLSYHEKSHSTYQEPPDLPFTGLPREKFSLRSPMPLLSEVTKRLTFNTSTTTPFQGRNSWYNRELQPTPYPSRGGAFTYCRKPKHFSLLNPALQRPSTVKIASPDVTVNRTFTISNSPLKRAADDWNPCSRVTVLSALKESRKRSFVVEDEEDELMRPTKRRDTKPADSYPFSSPLLASRKRVAIPESAKTTPDENFSKKSKVTSHSDSSEMLHSQTSVQKDSVIEKRKNRDSGTEKTNRVVNLESTETGEDESSNKKSKFIDRSTSSETVHSQLQADFVVQKRKDRATEIEETNISQQGESKQEDEGNQSKKAKSLVQQTKDDEAQRGRSEQMKRDTSSSPKQTKRFTVPRFASKEDSRRRAVPVYCASNEESEMPQRRIVSRKINQEQIKIDRRLAWERVKELLGGDEDEEEDEEAAVASKSGTTAVSSTAATTSTSSSLLKIPTAGAVTSAGTITTTTTQSLITPAPATGVPQRTTGVQGGPVTNAPVVQSQGTAVPSLQSQQASRPGLLANLSSNPGSSNNTSLAGTEAQSAVTAQTSGVVNLSKAPTVGLQANVSLTSTVITTPGPAGFQLSSSSSFGNSPFTKPATTNQLTSSSASSHKNTSGTSTGSIQQAGFSFTSFASSSSSGTSSTAAGQRGFTFAAASGAQNAASLGQNSTQNTPGTGFFNSLSTSALGAASSQKPATLSGSSSTTPSQNPFASFAKPTQNSSVSSAMPAPSGFGQSSNAAQSSFGVASQTKLTFGSTNMQSVLGQQTQSPFGGTPGNTSGFGSAQNTFGAAVSKSSTQSPFSQGTQGTQANQHTSQGAFGAQQKNQQGAASAFGKPSGKSAFANLTNTPGNFTFGSQVQQSATQNVFGSQTTQNAFGSQPNQNTTQSAFGSQPSQNAFGAQATQSAFGASSTQKTSSPFTFAANTAQNPSNSPFGGFGKPGTQSTFGAAPSQNATAPSGGFNFSASGSTPNPGGFNFNATANKPTGFQFGAAGSSGNFGQFGQTAQPGAASATPTPSGGFNFAPGSGGVPGSQFAPPAAAPAFGVPSTPQGAGSTPTARLRSRVAARRRGKK